MNTGARAPFWNSKWFGGSRMEVGLDHDVQRPLSYVCACQPIDLMLPGSLLSWFPSVLLMPVFVYWSFCDLGMSRPV